MIEETLAFAKDAAVVPVDLEALVREGKRLYCSKGYGMTSENIRAFNLFHRAAEAGHSEAQYLTYSCYWSEQGALRDEALELVWLRKSAESGFAEAQGRLGYYYYCGGNGLRDNKDVSQDYAEAAKWYRKAAAQGNAEAQCDLGRCYCHGKGLPQDYSEGAKWYRKSAEQGFDLAQSGLARCYAEGNGVPQDQAEAVRWCRKAAEQGFGTAQLELGVCYRDGIGIELDFRQAYKWFQLSADQGSSYAKAQASAIAALMSPSEFKSACALYQEFKDSHAVKE